MQDEAVYEPVDGAVAADPERKRENGDDSEAGPRGELPQGVAHVLKDGVHR
jgi:hypothetical protein